MCFYTSSFSGLFVGMRLFLGLTLSAYITLAVLNETFGEIESSHLGTELLSIHVSQAKICATHTHAGDTNEPVMM